MKDFEELKEDFLLRKDITFLNFGSFGATPKPIFEDYQNWQLVLEQEPVQFITVEGFDYLKRSRKALAEYIHCDDKDLIFVPNPTFAINILAKSLKFEKGDEILTTNLEYGAMDKTWDHYCEKNGVKYVRQEITLPIVDKETFINEFFKGLTDHTRMIFISQITSSTGLIFPVKEICEIAKEKGLMTIVDGAHVPGHIPLDISQLKADFYTGACHKWMMAPKGCSFLYSKKEFQDKLEPLVVSWGYKAVVPGESIYFDYHQFNGTRDFSAFLTIPACIQYMQENNWEIVSANCRSKVKLYAQKMAKLLKTQPLAPLTDEFYGQLCSTQINTKDPVQLQRLLFEKYKIEIPIMRHEDKIFIRFSIQGFNTNEEMDYLLDSIQEIMDDTDLITLPQ